MSNVLVHAARKSAKVRNICESFCGQPFLDDLRNKSDYKVRSFCLI